MNKTEEALFSVMDGVEEHELSDHTGLSEDENAEIWAEIERVRKLYKHKTDNELAS